MERTVSEVSISVKVSSATGEDERRVIFMRPDRVQELLEDTGSLGDLLRGIADLEDGG